ncbi:asparagine synthase (glutamine-hydrolyzing) [Sulfurimonas sp. HSL3-7]|uniref:asparagine synthase (glutamine-hydrolyzing) n=1 Tax=Sulfonitrofixus jiaomeiensis TaxID=3131938 RepID=UPI0031F8EC51
MCAIFGILGPFDPQQARQALSTMAHRGPDYCGIVEQERLFFAHNRLSIIDLRASAHQPMRHNEVLLSFNGEIYNHRALRQELSADFIFASDSDTEVLLAAYKKWGLAFVDRLVGMFAIALLDGEELYLFRDRLGKKPLFYLHNREQFIFASEIKGLAPFLAKKEMNKDALISYLGYLAPTPPHTFFKGIHKLEAGEMLHFDGRKIGKRPYYSLLDAPSSIIVTEKEALAVIEERLLESMRLRLNADVPMASLLSGGIDSALIAAIAKEQGNPLHTFTLGYAEYRNYDERSNACFTAEALGVRNSAIEITQDDFIGASEKVFAAMDEPLNDPAAIPLYLLFEGIKKEGYKVVFSGEGSDELFLGYRQYFEYLDIEKAATLQHKNWLKKYFRANFSMNREWEWYKRVFDDQLLFRTSGEKFTDLQKNMLLRQNIKDGDGLRFLEPYRKMFEASGHSDPSLWYSYIDLKLFQAEHFLAKLDRVSMAHSIESRTPFLDHNLAESVFSIAPQLRYRDGVTKALLKKIAAKYLPDEVIGRKKKGFSNPYMEWLAASGKIDLIEEVNEQTGLFNRDVLKEYIERGVRGRFKQHVWGLYVLSYWLKENLL